MEIAARQFTQLPREDEVLPTRLRQIARIFNKRHIMKRPLLPLLIALFVLPSCRTMHDAAVTTFRVVDAPHQLVRRALGVDESDTTTTTTTQTNVYADPNAPQQPYPVQQQPPARTERRVVTTREQAPTEAEPTPPPRVTQREAVAKEEETPPTRSTASAPSELPYAKPVPGKPGYVFSPYDQSGGYVDVTGYNPGQKVKDPYSGKIFLVP